MKRNSFRRMLLVIVGGLTLTVSGCGGSGDDDAAQFVGALEGMTGTRPAAENTAWRNTLNDFWVAQGNEPLTTFQYAAESYDAVILAALAAEAAGSDGSALADEIVALTRDGEKCTTFDGCRALIVAGADVDYDGKSGKVTMNGFGEVVETIYSVVEFGANNRIDLSKTVYDEIDGSWEFVPYSTSARTRPGDGVLKIGSILPLTGQLATYGPPQIAGVELAIAEINNAGGVLGKPVEYFQGDSGDSSSTKADATVDAMLAANVDVAIGPSSTTVTATVIERILGAQIVQISPANTNMQLASLQDDGLYFRMAPADDQQAYLLAKVMDADGARKVFIAAVDDVYGNAISARLRTQLSRRGIEVVEPSLYDPATADFGPLAKSMDDSGADSIVVIGFEESATLLRAMVRNGVGPRDRKVFGVDSNMGDIIGENFDVSSD